MAFDARRRQIVATLLAKDDLSKQRIIPETKRYACTPLINLRRPILAPKPTMLHCIFRPPITRHFVNALATWRVTQTQHFNKV